ncbi:hypothetical protein [Oharaeibacter diazotrophicus]|uniref:Uracil DNA glycosylase superfamily protein n=1 Tax=Oharaeibacter diazotrophicus TaxID=1920512 RepID=A0A4R6RE01_9HYPH|nr:hypothetical protein [Oharaeibacter diazotrophicus]TDP83947.1 hypothetical protein EDD54_2548 [Oharaeibacter diazotrophicus]BBE72987.1 hypothetical protein OHA_1_02592 [Pleomorphomonas sp. SM30]
MDSLLPKFAPLLAAATASDITSDPTLSGRLVLETAGPIQVSYAPFDHLNPAARIVLVGLTPGRQQAVNALVEASRQLKPGAPIEVADKAAKETASFSGLMRSNLVDILDHVGVAKWLGITSCSDLFVRAASLVHYTSALRYPVFVSGQNYSGSPALKSTPILAGMVTRYLAEEARSLPGAVWVPLGPAATSAVQMLVDRKALDGRRVLDGLPHPSGANGERIAYFLGRKEKAALSTKTNAGLLDVARTEILRRMGNMA